MTAQFKSLQMKFNLHSSPPPVSNAMYSQLHPVDVPEKAQEKTKL